MKQTPLPKIDSFSTNKNTVYLYLQEIKQLRQISKEKNVCLTSARNYIK